MPPRSPRKRPVEEEDSEYEDAAGEESSEDSDHTDDASDADEDVALATAPRKSPTLSTPTSSPRKKLANILLTPSPKRKQSVVLEPSPHKVGRFIARSHFRDIPQWKSDDCPLFTMPAEIADKILSDRCLGQRDHLSLAGTCHTLRAAYTDQVWAAISRRRVLVDRDRPYALWNAGGRTDENTLARIFSKRPISSHVPVFPRAAHHDVVVEQVHDMEMTQTAAMKHYKLQKVQLTALKCRQSYNGHNPRHPIELYLESAVEALAFRAHGGARGHEEHVAKLSKRAEKAKATRERNGTARKRRPKPQRPSFLYGDASLDYLKTTRFANYEQDDESPPPWANNIPWAALAEESAWYDDTPY